MELLTPPGSPVRRVVLPASLIALAILALWIIWSPPGDNDITASEGYYGTQARSILLDPRYPLSPPLRPMGEPGYKQPLYPALLALSIRALGANEVALRWPSLLCGALIAVALALLVARAAGPIAGAGAAALLMALPWYADTARSAASVIPLTALGAGALVVLAARPAAWSRALAAGALLGLGYECKMWLVVPLLLAALAMVGRRPGALAALLGATVVVGDAHLALVALFAPGQLPGWMMFGWRVFLWDWLTGARYAAALVHPPGFYWWILAHAFVLILPLVGLGAIEALRRWREPVPRAILVWALGAAGLSVMAVKLPVYLFAVVPAWVALASLGGAALATGSVRLGPAAMVSLALLMVAGSPMAARWAGDPGASWAPWALAWGAFIVAGLARDGASIWRRPAAFVLVMLGIAGGLARDARRLPLRYHDPGSRVVARAIAPRVADVPPGHTAMLSPDAPAFSYYLFRTARHWFLEPDETPGQRAERVAADTLMRVFITDRDESLYGGAPDSLMRAWLQSSTREITQEIEAGSGRSIGMRVFVREPRGHRVSAGR